MPACALGCRERPHSRGAWAEQPMVEWEVMRRETGECISESGDSTLQRHPEGAAAPVAPGQDYICCALGLCKSFSRK